MNKNNEISYEKIYKALYILNKSAKKSRDTANKSKNVGIVTRCRNRKNQLYKLKHAVMEKLVRDEKLTFQGIHFQEFMNNKKNGFYLAYFKTEEGFSYHRPATKKEIKQFKQNNLQELNTNQLEELERMTIISAEVKRKDNLFSFTEAVQVCLDYLGIKKEDIKNLKKQEFLKK